MILYFLGFSPLSFVTIRLARVTSSEDVFEKELHLLSLPVHFSTQFFTIITKK